MKPYSQIFTGTIGRLGLAITKFIHWDGICLLFFGELPFPEE